MTRVAAPGFASSIRARLFVTLMLAGAPGVLFGAIEARRQYMLAMQAARVQQEAVAKNAAAQMDTVLLGAKQVLGTVSGVAAVRDITDACPTVLRQALAEQRYLAFTRLTTGGVLVCASAPPKEPVDVSGADWFAALKAGSDFTASGLTQGLIAPEERVVLLSTPVRRNGRFAGAITVGLRRSWLDTYLSALITQPNSTAALLDPSGMVIAQADTSTARTRLGRSRHRIERRTRLAAQGLTLVISQPEPGSTIGFRAALIVLSPLMVAALSIIAVWVAMQAWVLRWHGHLLQASRAFARGEPLPPLQGKPPIEMLEQALALEDAVEKAKAREAALATALENNQHLSRELHHRVKNNLQILSSLASRQQRRTSDPAIQKALNESRAQLLAISLVYRFLQAPDELAVIDLQAYLTELARQLDVLFGADLRNSGLTLDIEAASAPADQVGALGLVVVECFVAAARWEPDPRRRTLQVLWRGASLDGPWRLTFQGPEGDMIAAMDLSMVRETARQLKVDCLDAENGRVVLARSYPSPEVLQRASPSPANA